MFDTRIRKSDYDRLNNVIGNATFQFYTLASISNLLVFAYSSYFFRYRKLTKIQVLAFGTGLYYSFGLINDSLYKVLVDRKVINEAKKMGYDKHVQPNGTFKLRGHNY